MALALPDGSQCFVDANILHYALVPTFDASPLCIEFVDRAIEKLISIATSVQVLSDVLHKIMASEAAELTGRERPGIIGYLKKHPDTIGRLVAYPQAIERLKMIPMQILAVNFDLLCSVPQLAGSHGLLTNDAIIVALMQRHGLTHLATNDNDFDRVPGITVWKPRP
jgi:predicted nucleic acid-binding protein